MTVREAGQQPHLPDWMHKKVPRRAVLAAGVAGGTAAVGFAASRVLGKDRGASPSREEIIETLQNPGLSIETLPNNQEQIVLGNAEPVNLVIRRGSKLTVKGLYKDEATGAESILFAVTDPLRKNLDASDKSFSAMMPLEGDISFTAILMANGGTHDKDRGIFGFKEGERGTLAVLDQATVQKERAQMGAFFVDVDPFKRNPDGTPLLHPHPIIFAKDPTVRIQIKRLEDGRIVEVAAASNEPVARARYYENKGIWEWKDSEHIDYSLRELTDLLGITVGTAITSSKLSSRKAQEVFQDEFNMAAPEIELLFDRLRPSQSSYSYANADSMVNRAKAIGAKVRGHHLVWGFQNIPDWLKNGKFTREEYINIMKDHIRSVMTHFKGKVDEWVVVNEPSLSKYRVRPDFWAEKIGDNYVEIAFQTAREVDNEAILLLNENRNHEPGKWLDQSLEIARSLKSKDLIDGIGMQMHVGGRLWPIPNKSDVLSSMRQFARLGLGIYVTEMDVNLFDGVEGVMDEQLQMQAKVYQDVVEALIESGAGKSITTWGISDAVSWLLQAVNNIPGEAPLIFDKDYIPKLAYFAIHRTLKQAALPILQRAA